MRYIVISASTSGEDAENDRVIELACIEIINDKKTHREFNTYLNPERPVSSLIKEYGSDYANDNFLKKQPLFKDIAEDFLEFIKDAVLVAFENFRAPVNSSIKTESQDSLSFLERELERCGYEYGFLRANFKILDPVMLAKTLYPDFPNERTRKIADYNPNYPSRSNLQEAHYYADLLIHLLQEPAEVFKTAMLKQINIY